MGKRAIKVKGHKKHKPCEVAFNGYKLKKDSKGKKRGRPKGKKKYPQYVKPTVPKVRTKMSMSMGYCKCGAIICKLDLETRFIYNCPSCGKRARVNKLRKSMDTGAPKSKKEYLEGGGITITDYIPLRDASIDPKHLRIAE